MLVKPAKQEWRIDYRPVAAENSLAGESTFGIQLVVLLSAR